MFGDLFGGLFGGISNLFGATGNLIGSLTGNIGQLANGLFTGLKGSGLNFNLNPNQQPVNTGGSAAMDKFLSYLPLLFIIAIGIWGISILTRPRSTGK